MTSLLRRKALVMLAEHRGIPCAWLMPRVWLEALTVSRVDQPPAIEAHRLLALADHLSIRASRCRRIGTSTAVQAYGVALQESADDIRLLVTRDPDDDRHTPTEPGE